MERILEELLEEEIIETSILTYKEIISDSNRGNMLPNLNMNHLTMPTLPKRRNMNVKCVECGIQVFQ